MSGQRFDVQRLQFDLGEAKGDDRAGIGRDALIG